jgi:hypothetical protein
MMILKVTSILGIKVLQPSSLPKTEKKKKKKKKKKKTFFKALPSVLFFFFVCFIGRSKLVATIDKH